MGKIMHKSSVKVREAQKSLESLGSAGCLPRCKCRNLVWVFFDAVFIDNKADVFHLFYMELALVQGCDEVVFEQYFQY